MATIHGSIQEFTRRVFATLVVLAVLFMPTGDSMATNQDTVPMLQVHVADFAKALFDRKGLIESKLKAFEAATGHQVFVLTVPTTGDRSMEEYAVEVFQKSKIGQHMLDDGVLFVIATAERKMRIEVGYGLEGVLTDAKCSRIIHDVVSPKLRDGQLDAGIDAGVDAILRTVAPSFVYRPPPPPASERVSPINKYALVAVGGIFALLFGLIAVCMGGFGLVVLGVFMLIFSLTFPGLEGQFYSAAIFTAWFLARWKLIANNVRKYHLQDSKNQMLTWLWCFLVMPGSGRPQRKGEPSTVTFSFSFGSAKSEGSGTNHDAEARGRGGRSGGAGATGGW